MCGSGGGGDSRGCESGGDGGARGGNDSAKLAPVAVVEAVEGGGLAATDDAPFAPPVVATTTTEVTTTKAVTTPAPTRTAVFLLLGAVPLTNGWFSSDCNLRNVNSLAMLLLLSCVYNAYSG